MDAKSGFWQIALTPQSQAVTAFSHPLGLSLWRRITFGLNNGPPHFQRGTNNIIRAAQLTDHCVGFVDDYGAGSTTIDENTAHLA